VATTSTYFNLFDFNNLDPMPSKSTTSDDGSIKELSELTAFELILLVTMGDLVQQGVTQQDQSLTGAILAVGTLGLLHRVALLT